MPDLAQTRSARRMEVPVLPLRDVVAFPHATRSFQVGRPRSVRLLEALPKDENERVIALVLQRNAGDEDPAVDELYRVGTLARVIRSVPVREGSGYLLLAAGVQRLRLVEQRTREPYLVAEVELIEDLVPTVADAEFLALRDGLRKLFSSYVERSPALSNELLPVVADLDDAALLSDIVATTLPSLTTPVRQQLLATLDVRARLRLLVEELVKDNERLDLEQRIQSEIRERVAGAQREYLLREQMKAIRRELGENEDEDSPEDDLRGRIDAAGLPVEVHREALRELVRLRQIPVVSPEHAVIRNYLDWITALPWQKTSGQPVDLALAERILDEDHYDIEKVKQRILEYLAVLRLRGAIRGPILCLAGPPGVGKTSLGRSIARALGRSFARLSLGGVHDEAELRGHRRTYVGAMPGQVIQAIRRAGSRDPVVMLDEVDKLGRDFRGDPASALLEVLDPEQNATFRDHYLDVPFDLSRVLFIATANVLDPIAAPLLDRMEVIELAGYSEEEKLEIARRYLVPKQVRENGLDERDVRFTEDALRELARHYTHEAGVRGLERQIGALCRKHARRVAQPRETDAASTLTVTCERVREDLGPPRHRVDTELARRTEQPGVAVGLAWTPVGGEVLFVEASRVPHGRGNVTLTGQLGDVMQESARAALTWLRAHGGAYGVHVAELKESDLHIHVPAGAVPKDGPSAGVVMVTALASALTGRRSRPDVAMTGEITLSGHVLPVGGIREKVLAARRAGVHTLVLPELNEPHVLEEITADLRAGMTFHYVRTIDEALAHALEPTSHEPIAHANGGAPAPEATAGAPAH